MKHYIRSFAIGLFTAGAVMLAVYLIWEKDGSNAKNITRTEMAAKLKDQGYRVVTEAEYIALTVQKEEAAQNKEKTSAATKKDADREKPDQAESPVKQKEEEAERSFTIQISSGMATSEISETLQDNGIIKDAKKFDDYLEKNDYAKYIQLGKHKLSSGMSLEEIAKALTK